MADARRVIVLGGFGFFGGITVELLRAEGIAPLIGSRRSSADVVVDVEDRSSLGAALRSGDVVIDAVGPYQKRTTLLIEVAVEVGFDVVDLADNLDYVREVYEMKDLIDAARIRVYTACSGMSSISAAMVQRSGHAEPVRLSGFLVPATRYTAVAGTAASLFYSVGMPIRVFEGGALVSRDGWRSARSFPMPSPVGNRTGFLIESVDSITLPALWSTLKTVEFFVDTNVRGLNTLFSIVARFPALRKLMDTNQRLGLGLSRFLGRSAGGLGYEIEGADGRIMRLAFTAENRGYITAVTPTVIVARRLALGGNDPCGLVTPDQHVDPDELVRYLETTGIMFSIEGDNLSDSHCEPNAHW